MSIHYIQCIYILYIHVDKFYIIMFNQPANPPPSMPHRPSQAAVAFLFRLTAWLLTVHPMYSGILWLTGHNSPTPSAEGAPKNRSRIGAHLAKSPSHVAIDTKGSLQEEREGRARSKMPNSAQNPAFTSKGRRPCAPVL